MDEVRLPLENELAEAYAGRQEEKALRESDRRCVAWIGGARKHGMSILREQNLVERGIVGKGLQHGVKRIHAHI